MPAKSSKSTKSTVAMVKGLVRYDGVFKALELIEPSVKDKISNSMRIVIKPDFFFPKPGLCTSVDTVKAVLDFVLEFTNKKITIAEGLYNGAEIQSAFHKALLHELHEQYGVKYVDLNKDEFVVVSLGKNLSVRVAKTMLQSDFRVSLAIPKLINTSFSAAMINMAVGSIISNGTSIKKNDKKKLLSSKHYGAAIAELLKLIHPSLAVVDGFESVADKRSFETNFCVASADPVATDTVAAAALTKTLGRKVKKQRYLELCSKFGLGRIAVSKLKVVGERL